MNRKQRRAAAKLSPVGDNTAQTKIEPTLQAGLEHHRSGRLSEAEASYRQILAIQPDHSDALHLLGFIAYQMKHYDAAVDLIGRAIKENASQANYFCSLGLALHDQGKLEEAFANYEKALALNRDYPEAHYNRGRAMSDMGRLDDALASYDRALTLRPNYLEAHINRGSVLIDLKRFNEALASCDRALALDPRSIAAHNNRANTLQKLGRMDEAISNYNQALTLDPNLIIVLNNRANTLRKLRRFDAALADYDKVLTLDPNCIEAIDGRGTVFRDLGRLEEALACYDKALSLNPNYAQSHNHRGLVLTELKRFNEAFPCYKKAISIDPNYADAHWNESILLRLLGNFEHGWAKAEWRWKSPILNLWQRNFSKPYWLGDEPIEGKRILVYSDEGLGDAIQFCRYIPMLAAQGAHVIVEVQESLRQLMSGIAGVSQCIARMEALPDFDFYCAINSLPLAFKTRLKTIPSATPYLTAPALSPEWEARLGRKDRLRIGLTWSGNQDTDPNRSFPLHMLKSLLEADATFVSLQKELLPHDEATLQERADIINFGPSLKSFAETAALMAQLDLVITIDTSVAHLAGALGRPVWILLKYNSDWRWLLDREDSPWYPTARLFRQSEHRQWAPVIERVRQALADFTERWFAESPAEKNYTPRSQLIGSSHEG